MKSACCCTVHKTYLAHLHILISDFVMFQLNCKVMKGDDIKDHFTSTFRGRFLKALINVCLCKYYEQWPWFLEQRMVPKVMPLVIM